MAAEDRSEVIDETPISPVRPASHVRQNSLEKHLQHRPDPKELRDRHILLDTNAAPYASPTLHPNHAMTAYPYYG
jgi:RPEL repeat